MLALRVGENPARVHHYTDEEGTMGDTTETLGELLSLIAEKGHKVLVYHNPTFEPPWSVELDFRQEFTADPVFTLREMWDELHPPEPEPIFTGEEGHILQAQLLRAHTNEQLHDALYRLFGFCRDLEQRIREHIREEQCQHSQHSSSSLPS